MLHLCAVENTRRTAPHSQGDPYFGAAHDVINLCAPCSMLWFTGM